MNSQRRAGQPSSGLPSDNSPDMPAELHSARPPCFALLSALLDADATRIPAASMGGLAVVLDVPALALSAAQRLGRSDAIVSVAAAPLGDVDGALYHTGAGAWMLLYHQRLDLAEARFVQAWLLGCYALHGRLHLARGCGAPAFECRLSELYRLADLDSPSARAYSFAARLLMPDAVCHDALRGAVDMEALLAFGRRVQVPVWHAARRWIERTAQKAALVLDDGARVRACWLSETAHGAGLHLDIAAASLCLSQRQARGEGDVAQGGERLVSLSAWFADAVAPTVSRPRIDESFMPIFGIDAAAHRFTLLRLPREARAARRHAWGQHLGAMLSR